MNYKEEIDVLRERVRAFEELKKRFYEIYGKNPDAPELAELAANANRALNNAIRLRTHMNEELTKETKGYPKNGSRELKSFDELSDKISELAKERKAKRTRKLFKQEGKKIVEKTNKEFKDRMQRIKNRQTKTKKMVRETPELAWWRLTGMHVRASAFNTRNLERGKALKNKLTKNWQTKTRYGLTTHLIGRFKSRKKRKMKP